ncbi:hypothetical protein GIB67_039727 [Kingdonia uniflora]|uniref:Uncharacterized protein n=1 Tax=Kingdonia uniflora TaxID=39325 RepID=A0A7J7MQ05_9MAGN|nr:hypothetical protein GIB67_039727 [Kingdonia uniflora]
MKAKLKELKFGALKSKETVVCEAKKIWETEMRKEIEKIRVDLAKEREDAYESQLLWQFDLMEERKDFYKGLAAAARATFVDFNAKEEVLDTKARTPVLLVGTIQEEVLDMLTLGLPVKGSSSSFSSSVIHLQAVGSLRSEGIAASVLKANMNGVQPVDIQVGSILACFTPSEMVKARSMVLEERIASEAQRLKLKYFGDQYLEMAIPAPVPPTYRGLLGEEAVEAEEDFYYKWRFYVFVLTDKERWACLRTLAEDRSFYGWALIISTNSAVVVAIEEAVVAVKEENWLEGSAEGERQKISGINQELSEDDKQLKRAKGSGSRRWEYYSVVMGNLDSSADLHLDFEGVKSTVERKEPLLDEVAEEETELELVLGELGLSRKKRVKSKLKKVAKAQSTRSMTGVDEGTRKINGEEIRAKTPVSGNDIKEVEERARLAILQGKEDTSQMEFKLKKVKNELEKNLAQAKTDALKEVKQLKAAHVMAIGQLQVEAKANLDEMTEERDRLCRHLMLKGYSQEEVDAIKADTYAEEEEKEAEVLGVVDSFDGVSPQTVFDNQGDDIELPEGGSEEVELDASRVREDHTLMCNREFSEQFNRMKKANENWEDQYVNANFRLEKLNKVVSDLTHQVEEKDSGIEKGLEDLSKALKRAENLQHQRGNVDLRECQLKLDAVLIREFFLEGEIRAKDLLVMRKDELLKDLPAREELNAELGVYRDRVVELQAMNLAKSKQYIAKLKEDAIRHDKIDADRNTWKDTYASVKVRHERLKARFAKAVVPDVSRSAMLSVIVTYFA